MTVTFGVLVLTVVLWRVLREPGFTTADAKALVEAHQFRLEDPVELKENQSIYAIGDYYHTFTLTISDRDKQRAIANISDARNFQPYTSSGNPLDDQLSADRYSGKTMIQNAETEKAFVRQYVDPSGHNGYTPVYKRISISKTNNELTFEDIDE